MNQASEAASPPARWLRRLATGGFLLSLAAGMLVPVYSDEIGWRFQERAWVDGGLDVMFSDICGPNTIARAPWFMMPVRMFSALANQALADPLFVRVAGVACALLWAALLWLLTVRLERDPARRSLLQALSFGLLGIGVLPYLLIWSRPEQPIILTMTLMILLAFATTSAADQRVLAWLKASAIVLLAGIAISYHLKGVLYAPVALVCLAVCAKGRATLVPRLAGIAVLLALSASAAHYWVGRFQCPADPILAAKLGSENIAAVFAGGSTPIDLLLKFAEGAHPWNYIWLTIPDNIPMSDWLPPELFPPATLPAIGLALTVLWIAVALVAMGALALYLLRNRINGFAEPRLLLALAILGCITVWGASQINRNVYEAAHVLPLLVIFVLMCFTLPLDGANWRERALPVLVKAVVPLALLSQAIVLGSTVVPLARAAQTPGYLAAQPFSVSIAGYGGVRRDIARAMALSGIPRDRRLNRLMIDDLTYFATQRSRLPLHRLGVIDIWNGSIEDPVRYLISRDSDGVVVGCHYLPANMRQAAARSGPICALSRAGLARLAFALPK